MDNDVPPSKRGISRKAAGRAEADKLPCAWVIGDRKSFARVKAKTIEGICLDFDLSGKEKTVLATAIGHMNASERWSCWAENTDPSPRVESG